MFKVLEDNHVAVVLVPPNCTDHLQPLDMSVNKLAKNFLRQQFQEWYATQICQQLQSEDESKPVDLRLSIMKPLKAKWLVMLYDYFKSREDIIKNGFKGAGITNYLAAP